MASRLRAPERRALIEEAAEEVFARRGYHSASLGEIAAAAGISKPVIYDHFGSKRDLHLSLLEKTRDALFERLATGAGQNPGERFRAALDAFFQYVELHPYAWRMLFRETTGNPEVVAAHVRVQAQADERIAQVLAAGGLMTMDPMMTAVLVKNATNGLAIWWGEHPEVPRAAIVEASVRCLYDGIGSDSDER
ncbi:MAG: TetR/AcrR family transcriptional regulator [Thermoleophilaceae bacterium]|nr:TetR/AcrR family transcriptional regulator [Thermoleophilaceae bacterium]